MGMLEKELDEAAEFLDTTTPEYAAVRALVIRADELREARDEAALALYRDYVQVFADWFSQYAEYAHIRALEFTMEDFERYQKLETDARRAKESAKHAFYQLRRVK